MMVLIEGLAIWVFESALLGLPALIAGALVYAGRRRLARPWIFFVVATLALYAVTGIAMVLLLPPGWVGMKD